MQAKREGRRAFVWMARAGYAARGVVSLVIGVFAVTAAVEGRRPEANADSQGALRTLLDAPLGEALLALVAFGLLGYALWRAAQAAFDLDRHGRDLRALAVRGGQTVSAATHLGLAWFAAELLLAGTAAESSSADRAAWLMRQPYGRWLVGAAGLAVLGAGGAQAYKGWTEGFRRFMPLSRTPAWTVPVSRFGLFARGVVFAIVGSLLLVAAWRRDPSEAGGLPEAFAVLQAQPYGWVLFAVVAAGVSAFGVYSLLQAVYRRVDAPS